MSSQLDRVPGDALPVRRSYPPSDVSFDVLAVATHCSAPSSPLVKSGRNGEASTFLAEGVSARPDFGLSIPNGHSPVSIPPVSRPPHLRAGKVTATFTLGSICDSCAAT